ncbi:MAG: UvrD-helicase domain-containing protein [Saccharofermentans sp.]|nr:UvrD-helicase domain-containing protein [Saccharofermentans sp.]
MDYTTEQRHVVEDTRGNILVAAAAGSGKTTSMVGRIMDEILNKGLSIDRILVVTFTVDAAAHMLEKIEASIKSAVAEAKKKGDIELARAMTAQLDLLPSCYIQTFDSFCARVIKEKGYCIAGKEETELFEPGNIVLDENIKNLIRLDSAYQAIQEAAFYSTGDDDFAYLSQRFGDGRSDDELASFVDSCYDTLRSIPDYIEVAEDFLRVREDRDEAGKLHFEDDEQSPLTMAIEHLRDIREAIFTTGGVVDYYNADKKRRIMGVSCKTRDSYDQYMETSNFFTWIRGYLDEVISKYDSKADVKDLFASFIKAQQFKEFNFKPATSGKEIDIDEMNEVYAPLFAFNNFVTGGSTNKLSRYTMPSSCRELLSLGSVDLLQAQKDGTRAIRALVDILRRMDVIFANSKKLIHGMDFDDQEHAAHTIVKEEEAAAFYRDKFDEIFIDEYQDNTRLQDKIIELISRPEGNIFRVGDVKQSIYRFRHADPEMFSEKMKTFTADASKGSLLLLTENHRSTEEVLSFVNFIFKQAMTEKGSEIEYDDTQRFNVPSDEKKVKHGDLPRVVMVNYTALKDDAGEYYGESGDENESYGHMKPETKALCIGVESEVRHYLSIEGTELKDICILTTTKGKAETITRYLNDRDLKAAGRTTTSIFEDIDIHRLVNFIICLGNELCDDYLVSVLLSDYKMSNFSVKELGNIMAMFTSKEYSTYFRAPLKVRLEQYAEHGQEGDLKTKVKKFVDDFDDLRSQAMTLDIDAIIELIYSKTDIKATVAAKDGDSFKLDFFKDWLASNFKRFGTDISGIAANLKDMKLIIKSDANIEIKDNDKNKITVMNVHKSKGLEFKYLIFALDDKDDKKDTVSQMMFDKNDGFIIDAYDYEKISRCKSFEQVVYTDKLDIAANAEKQRLLYVALTRAEQGLSVVSGYGYSKEKNELKPSHLANALVRASMFEGEKFDREFYLNGNKKMSYTFFTAIARTHNNTPITGLADNIIVNREIDFEDCHGNKLDKGFEFVIMNEPSETETVGSEAQTEDQQNKLIELVDFNEKGEVKADPYRFNVETKIPFKTSVTSFEKHEGKIAITPHVDLEIEPPSDFESIGSRLSAASEGTILHRIMAFIDLKRMREHPEQLEDEIRELTDSGVFREYGDENPIKVALKFERGIICFAESEYAIELEKAEAEDQAFTEKHVLFAVPAVAEDGKFDEGSDGFALVQGIIDLVYKSPSGYVIVDYKTDDLSFLPDKESRAKEALKRHSFQLTSYAMACEASGMKVAHKLIYLVRYGQFVEV